MNGDGDRAGATGLPLDGLTVVSVEQAVAAPFATRQLADLGARVVKIEHPEGGDFARAYDHNVEGLGTHFVWLNRSKESVAVDLKAPEGRALVRELIGRADAFVQNLAPGAADRLGLSAKELRAVHPRPRPAHRPGPERVGPHRSRDRRAAGPGSGRLRRGVRSD